MTQARTKQTQTLYRPLDAFLEKAKKRIKREFLRLSLVGFDQLNVIQTKRMTQAMYDRLDEFNRKEYERLARHAWHEAYGWMRKKPREMDYLDFVMEYLDGYDPVTQYIYTKEVERKRMRLAEAILTAREYSDRSALDKAVKKAADLWYTQTMQYGIDLMTGALMAAFEAEKETRLMWNAVIDGRECNVCHSRNGQVYSIRDYPPRPHYGCRCYPTVVR